MARCGSADFIKMLDLHSSGCLSREELIVILTNINFQGADRLVASFAGPPTGSIKLKDFTEWLCSGGEVATIESDGRSGHPQQCEVLDVTPSLNSEPLSPSLGKPGRKLKHIATAVGKMGTMYRRHASAVTFSTEAYARGSLQDNPALPLHLNVNVNMNMEEQDVKVESLFGSHKFKGAEAAPWLDQYGLRKDILDDITWTVNHAEAVAAAVSSWAMSKGATMVCHWTQALRSANGTWRGSAPTRMVHALFNPGMDGKAVNILDGSYLLHGEGDSRKMIDITSAMWVHRDVLFIPSVFVNYNNSNFNDIDPVLCEKTPLLRAMHAISLAGVRLLGLLGHRCTGVVPKIGLEQEFFLVPRTAYDRRLDLQRCGRTLFGELGHGGCLYDTHSDPMNEVAHACMAEIQSQCFSLGIHLRTRHRESAPNQYEYAPHFGVASAQVDENLVVMEIIENVARKFGLAALLHEKPFEGCNGSGKHNNFSLGTDTGLNLFNEVHTKAISSARIGPYEAFPIIMAAVCSAVFRHGNLLMSSVACPGNDFRLSKKGGNEAPPTCISIHLGESLTQHLTEFANSTAALPAPYALPKTNVLLGIPAIDQHGINVSTEPRNRTAPLPYAGRRFELRSCGSSQNVAMVNVTLCTMIAEGFNLLSDEIERGVSPREAASKALKEGGGLKAIFNNNNYTEEWRAEAEARGLICVDSVFDAICQLREDRSVDLFERCKVLSRQELDERVDVMLENYYIIVEVEVRCMLDVINGHLLPAWKAAGLDNTHDVFTRLVKSVADLQEELEAMHDVEEVYDQAAKARDVRLSTMPAVRALVNQFEKLMPASQWPMATYHDLLFDDMKHCSLPGAV